MMGGNKRGEMGEIRVKMREVGDDGDVQLDGWMWLVTKTESAA